MKIVIMNGFHQADYIIGMFHSHNNELIVVNESEEACKYLSSNHGIPVILGKGTRESDLRDAGAEDADLFIALSSSDMDNYVACKTAKQLLSVKRSIALVVNPKNVEVFKRLGVDSAISSTYLLGEQIRNAASIENLMNSLSLEDSKVIILEFRITKEQKVCGESLKDINISSIGSISSVTRGQKVLIPNGNTVLQENDKVLIVTTEENQAEVIRVFQRKAHE